MEDTCLVAVQRHGVWMVNDASGGGTWVPDDDAAAEIDAQPDPGRAAVAMCRDAPMRGTWRQ